MSINTASVAIVIFLWSCGPVLPPEPAPAPITPTQEANCETMCAHLQKLGCEEGRDTPGGATCEEVCTLTIDAGLDVHPECVVGVEKCEDVGRASQGCGS